MIQALSGASTDRPISARYVDYTDGEFVANFPEDTTLAAILKTAVTGIRYVQRDGTWRIKPSVTNVDALSTFVERQGFSLTPAGKDAFSRCLSEAQELLAASFAHKTERSMRLGEFNVRPYQILGIEFLMKVERGLLADDMGLGKTLQLIGAMERLIAYPACIITKAGLKDQLAEELTKALPDKRILVCNSKSHTQQSLWWEAIDVYVVNYNLLSEKWANKKKTAVELTSLAQAILKRGLKFIAVDEAQEIKDSGSPSQRRAACEQMAEGIKYRIASTGTPMENRPREFIGIMEFLGCMKDFGGVTNYKKRYCDLKEQYFNGRRVWTADGAKNTHELGQLWRSSRMIRRLKREVLNDLPELTRQTVSVELSNREEYDRAEQDIVTYVFETAMLDQKQWEAVSHLPASEQQDAMRKYAATKERRARQAQALVKMSVLRKLVAQGKREAAVEWIKNFGDGARKLVVFADYIESQKLFREAVSGSAAILGEMSGPERTAEAKRFSETDTPVISCSIRAAGAGLNLQAASDILGAELPWNAAVRDQCESRCHRSGQKNAVNAWWLVAKNTVDQDAWATIEEKGEACANVLDNANLEESFNLKVIDKLMKRHGK